MDNSNNNNRKDHMKNYQDAWRLSNAIKSWDVNAVATLLAEGLDPNYYLSGLSNSIESVVLGLIMIKSNNLTNNNLTNEVRQRNLARAKDGVEIIKALLNAGADPNLSNALFISFQEVDSAPYSEMYEPSLKAVFFEVIELLLNHPHHPASPDGHDGLLLARLYLSGREPSIGKMIYLLEHGARPDEAALLNFVRIRENVDSNDGFIAHMIKTYDHHDRIKLALSLLDVGFSVPSGFTKESFVAYLEFLRGVEKANSRLVTRYLAHVEHNPKDFNNLALKYAILRKATIGDVVPFTVIGALLDTGVIVNEFEPLCALKRSSGGYDTLGVKRILHQILDYVDTSKLVRTVPLNIFDMSSIRLLILNHPNIVIGRLKERDNADEMPTPEFLGVPLQLSRLFTTQLLSSRDNPSYTMPLLVRMISRIERRIASVTELKGLIGAEIEKHRDLSDVSHLVAYNTQLDSQLETLKTIQTLRADELASRDDELKRYCESMSSRPSLNLSALLLRESEFFMGSGIPKEVQAIIINKALRNDFDKHFPDKFFEYLTDAIIDRAKKTTLKSKTGGPVVFEDVLSTRTWLPGGKVSKVPRPEVGTHRSISDTSVPTELPEAKRPKH